MRPRMRKRRPKVAQNGRANSRWIFSGTNGNERKRTEMNGNQRAREQNGVFGDAGWGPLFPAIFLPHTRASGFFVH